MGCQSVLQALTARSLLLAHDCLPSSMVTVASSCVACRLPIPCCVCSDIPGGAILSTTEERLRLGCDCLMSQVPFWLPGQAEVVKQLVAALDDLQVRVCGVLPFPAAVCRSQLSV